MKQVFVTSLLLTLLFSGLAIADGPETGIVSGTVEDGSGTPLPGVTVTLIGSRGEQSSITGNNGSYRFALLPPGSYTVRAELEGFQGKERVVTVSAGRTAEADISLRLGTSEEITVTSEAPMVDKFNVTAGATVTSEVGQETAGSTRTYYGVINTLPGVTSDAENNDIQQTRPSVNGTHFADQQVFIDGVDTTFAKFGGSRVFLPTTAVTEVTMEAGGSSAEYGRAIGSQTNVIVKSGTNTLHIDALVQHQQVDWGGDYDPRPELQNREVTPLPDDFFFRTPEEEDGDSTGYEFSIGGPMLRDKAWFFIGASQFDDNYLEQSLGDDPIDTSLENEAYIAKLNFQPGASHQLSASYIETPAKRVYFNPETYDYWVPTPHDVEGELATLNWNWSASQNIFLEMKLAAQTSTENKQLACGSVIIDECLALKQQDRGPDGEGPLRFPADPSMGEHWPGNNYRVYLDTNFLGAWHNGWILSDGFGNNDFPRDQANAAMTQFIGANHELKYGIDYQQTEWTGNSARPGLYSGFNYTSFNPYGFVNAGSLLPESCGIIRGDSEICLWRDYNADFLVEDRGTGDSSTEVLAGYVRDRFTIGDHWTFNLGLRFEDQEGRNDIDRVVFEDTYVSPRASVSYDVKGDGRMLFSLNTGRYHALLNQEWIAQHLHDQWNGFEGYRDYLFCDPIDAAFIPSCGGSVGYNFFLRDVRPGEMWDFVDAGLWNSDITPYYKDEIILGFEWQFSRNWALDVKAIQWQLENMIGATIQLGPDGQQFKMVANYEDYPAVLQALDDARAANGNPRFFADNDNLDNWYEGRKDYEALQLQINRRFANGWALYNNVTWSETETTGAGAWWNNTNSDYGEDYHVVLTEAHIARCTQQQVSRTVPIMNNDGSIGCEDALTPFIGQPVSTINRYGKEGNIDRPIIWNSFGFKTWTFGKQDVTLGGHLNFSSGAPWARSESVPSITIDGNTAQNASVGFRTAPNGANGRRLSSFYTLNLSGAYGFPLGGRTRGQFRVEVLNVTNQQRQMLITGRGEARPVRRDFQRPRQVRASFSIRF